MARAKKDGTLRFKKHVNTAVAEMAGKRPCPWEKLSASEEFCLSQGGDMGHGDNPNINQGINYDYIYPEVMDEDQRVNRHAYKFKNRNLRRNAFPYKTDVDVHNSEWSQMTGDSRVHYESPWVYAGEKEKITVFDFFLNRQKSKLAGVVESRARKFFLDLYLRDQKILEELDTYLYMMMSVREFGQVTNATDLKDFEDDYLGNINSLRKNQQVMRRPETVAALVAKYSLNNLDATKCKILMDVIAKILIMRGRLGIGFAYHYLKLKRQEREKKAEQKQKVEVKQQKKKPVQRRRRQITEPVTLKLGQRVVVKDQPKQEFKVVVLEPENSAAIIESETGPEQDVDIGLLKPVSAEESIVVPSDRDMILKSIKKKNDQKEEKNKRRQRFVESLLV